MTYSKVNLFTGRYRTGLLGKVGAHIGLEDATLRILRGIETDEGWLEDPQGDFWLIVQHGNFWPVMVRLDEEDLRELRSLTGQMRVVTSGAGTYFTNVVVPS